MRPTLRKIFALALVFVLCTAATIYLNRPDTDTAAEQGSTYYFANYASAESLLAVQIDNGYGNVTLISANGEYYAYKGETEVSASGENIQALFAKIYRLPLESYLSGAVSSDSQYGLTEPEAKVYIQNTDGDAFMFYIGGAAPSGASHYVCLAGDDRVFLMSDEYAQLFLSETSIYSSN